ncbi:hypothetical protein Bbelb_149290 [Branchiostoma belcheri]|nr:hypothetical protein Bbelb_149290 [Branchiostoma belcheri]
MLGWSDDYTANVDVWHSESKTVKSNKPGGERRLNVPDRAPNKRRQNSSSETEEKQSSVRRQEREWEIRPRGRASGAERDAMSLSVQWYLMNSLTVVRRNDDSLQGDTEYATSVGKLP